MCQRLAQGMAKQPMLRRTTLKPVFIVHSICKYKNGDSPLLHYHNPSSGTVRGGALAGAEQLRKHDCTGVYRVPS